MNYLLINVFLSLPLFKSFTYKIPEHLIGIAKEGARVIVPFKERKILGFIYEDKINEIPEEKVKEVHCILDEEPLIKENLLKLIKGISSYYLSPLGETFKLIFPPALLKIKEPFYSISFKGKGEGQEELFKIFQKPLPLSLIQKDKEIYEKYLYFKSKNWIEIPEGRKSKEFYITLYTLPPINFEILKNRVGKSKKKLEILEFLKNFNKPLSYGEIKRNILVEESLLSKMCRENFLIRKYKEKTFFPQTHWIPEKKEEPLFNLTEKQREIYENLKESFLEEKFKVFLLYGITGSGKSEIYLHLTKFVIERGGKVLILVPEIGLTPVLATRAINLWKERVSIYHSNLNERERYEVYKKTLKGEIDIVVGTRSALFLPLNPLKLIIVDEEQDSSYKQEETPRYNGRDVAVLRGKIENCMVLLSSATPSMESLHNCERGKYTLLKLKERVEKRSLPHIHIIDIKKSEILSQENGWVIFTKPLMEKLKENLEKNFQAILLIQRRGYAPILMCRICGNSFLCPNCSISFTVHKRKNKLICHWCSQEKEIPSKCSNCGGEILESIGIATERIGENFQKFFPNTPYGILDRDTISKKGELKSLLYSFEKKKTKVLIGTQIVAKGHHFPNVTFVGILNADFLLKFPDFRGTERLFDLIVQVAGRAGRGEIPGEVYIQTENPEHYVIKLALTQDFENFYEKEKYYRKLFNYPPFSSLSLLTIHSKSLKKVIDASNQLKNYLKNLNKKNIKIQGPFPAPLKKLKKEFRYQFLFRSEKREILHKFLENLKPFLEKKLFILDVDPLNFL